MAKRNRGELFANLLSAPQSNFDSDVNPVSYEACRVSGFITKVFEIFSDDQHSNLCCWGRDGKTILIRKISEFEAVILPMYFKHSKFASFVRQLNMYAFHKTVANPQIAEFHHQYFQRGRTDILHLIKRKARSGSKAVDEEDLAAQQQQQQLSMPPSVKGGSRVGARNGSMTALRSRGQVGGGG
eukprot:CAMPEP_0171876922 /NCGR_PEP_ID=MMETSP0992-20121227/36392_1 /TAXON_ID=483369 /ORGANISM="non described non described, Strain CCMP2098" /LENGTH=183 /DNA_ID=CAMNT_0012502079 /DNA_START=47 /DNA_END=594 /DNA_ORIENTATION=+